MERFLQQKLKKILLLVAFVISGSMWGQTFDQITANNDLTTGEYLIVGDGTSNDGMMINTLASTPYINFSGVTNPGASITTGYSADNIFQITVSSTEITIYNASVGYVSWGGNGNTANTASFVNGTPGNNEKWTFSVSGGLWTLNNVGTPARILQWNNTAPRFASYTSNQVKLKLYKKQATACVAPTTQAALTSASSTSTATSITMPFTSGNGTGRVVKINTTNSFTTPANGSVPTANTVYTSGQQVVSAGNGNSVTVTGLTAGTIYYFAVYEYDCTGTLYNTTPGTANKTTAAPAPEINITQGTSIATGSTYAFGNQNANTSSNAITFTVQNTGTGALTLGTLTLSGINADQYSSTQPVVTTVPANGNTTFTVTFSPTSNGINAASISLINDDNNENPYVINLTGTGVTPSPEISITQGTSIATGGNYAFGNQTVNSSSNAITFTVQNTGTAALTVGALNLGGTNASEFSITQPLATSITAGGSTTFTVTFSPTLAGSKTANISLVNNDSDENPYVINLTAAGTNSSTSNIIANSGFTYESNIDYTLYNVSTITNSAQSLGVFGFTIQDGGGSADTDTQPTTLNAISFTYTGTANTIKAAALFNGNTLVANGTVAANGISFTGLSGTDVTATDGATANLTLRVTFGNTVNDNQQLQFTVSSAAAAPSGSAFATANAGAATSSITNDRNRIEVTASQLAFVQQPTSTAINTSIAPAVTVSANDINGNRDLDFTGSVNITSTGTLSGTPVTANAASGLATFSSIQHTTTATGRILTAAYTTWSVQSTAFDVSDIASGTYRTASNGNWPGTSGAATWQRFTNGAWGASSAPPANTTSLLIIRHAITTNAAYAAPIPGTNMVVENGGTFTSGHNSTYASLTVKNGGTFSVIDPATTVHSTGIFTVDNGGKLVINSATLENTDGLWNGTENFTEGSTVEIQNWDYDNSNNGAYYVIATVPQITPNTDGYFFGNLIVNAAPTEDPLRIISNSYDPGTGNMVKLCQNNLEITNNGTQAVNMAYGAANRTFINGNVIINKGTFRFSNNTVTTTHTVNGDLLVNNAGEVSINSTNQGGTGSVVILKGNLDVKSGGSLTNNGPLAKYVFGGAIEQTISIVPSLGTNVRFEIAAGANVKLINQNLALSNSTNTFTVLTGGILNFNYRDVSGSGTFTQETGGILKITSAAGVTSGATGNVQNTGTRTFSQTGEFHYVGNVTPQATGNAITTGSTAKRIVVDKDNATDVVNLTQGTGISNNTNGLLYIKKGIFTETETANIGGSGPLTIDAAGVYKTAVTSDNVPQLTGTYTLADGSTIELNAASGTQTLKGGKDYANLTFSTGGIKTLSTGVSSITGTILIKDTAVLNTATSRMGGAGTNLTMQNTAKFITGGSSTKPDAAGIYTLGNDTTIEFAGTSATNIRMSPQYSKVVVSGTNVGISSSDNGLAFQTGGSFEVVNGATFKVKNTAGFNGGATTAITTTGNPAIILGDTSTIEYSGTANQVITGVNTTAGESTSGYGNLSFSGSGAKTLDTNYNYVRNNLTISEDPIVVIEAGKTFKVVNRVINNGDDSNLGVQNNAALLQVNDVDNTGAATVVRRSNPLFRLDYTLWSAPVTGQKLSLFSPFTATSRFYTYGGPDVNGVYQDYYYEADITQNFEEGKSYLIRMPNSINGGTNGAYYGGTQTFAFEGTFKGIPNNGLVEFPLSQQGDYFTATGNPYPSPINLYDFFNDVNNMAVLEDDAAIYLWRKKNNANVSSYASLNLTGMVANQGTPENAEVEPDPNYDFGGQIVEATYYQGDETQWMISQGQGFIVKAKTGLSNPKINFTNSMRRRSPESGGQPFLRTGNTNETASKFWLNLKGSNNGFSQIIVAYKEGATLGLDYGYDGKKLTDASTVSLFTYANENKLAIQARPSFEDTDEVQLGYTVTAPGEFTISLDHMNGVFTGSQSIYIKDNLLDITHNIKDGTYAFTSDAGTFANRFTIVYVQQTMGTDLPNDVANTVIVYQHNGTININSGSIEMTGITIYDLAGREIYSQDNINASLFVIENLNVKNQAVILYINTPNGRVTKKILL